MSFTRGQQPEFRKLLAIAWRKACEFDPTLLAGDRCKASRCGECSYCQWYEDLLEGATGHRSTTDCNAGRDYDFVMRALEAIIGDSFKWHLKAANGDANRIRHELQALCTDHEIADSYMQAIARQALRLDLLPALEDMSRDQLATVLVACKQHVTRQLVAEGKRLPQVSRATRREKRPQVKSTIEDEEEDRPF